MRLCVSVLMLTILTGGAVSGQTLDLTPERKARPPRPSKVPVDQKMRYTCKQLDLTEKQWQHVDGLFVILEADKRSSPDDLRKYLERMQAVVQERDAARAAGEQERARELNDKLQEMAPGRAAEKKFIAALIPALSEEQKAKLKQVQKDLEGVKDLSLKPIQVVRLAREFKLSPEQQKKLDAAQLDFRRRIVTVTDLKLRAQLLQKLVGDTAAVLEGEDRLEFERRIDKMRPDTPPLGRAKVKPVDAPAGDKGD